MFGLLSKAGAMFKFVFGRLSLVSHIFLENYNVMFGWLSMGMESRFYGKGSVWLVKYSQGNIEVGVWLVMFG